MSKQHENLNKLYTKSLKQSKTSTNPAQLCNEINVIPMQRLTTRNELIDTNPANFNSADLSKVQMKRSYGSSINLLNNFKKTNNKNENSGFDRIGNKNNVSSLKIPTKYNNVSNNRNLLGTLSPAVSDATINLKSTDGDEVFDNKSTYSRAGIYQNRISKMISKSNLVVFYFMKTRYLISMAVRV